ncbi:MAG: glycosyltransferase family 39 protein [Candidatus Aenigmarchaeota archaeon]|nr:glycosyltransferase family 39 protein [Candidatus Aenigmarchaeota archaeon]
MLKKKKMFLKLNKKYLILIILFFSLILRLIFFSGDGLGDDPVYFAAFKNIYNGHITNSQYYYRFSYWIPLIIIWKLFGISEFTFILPVLLSSLGNIYLVYLIAKELFDFKTGIIASVLMAVNPFEVLNATLMSTDVNLSLYMLSSVYFFITAQKKYSKTRLLISALFVFLAFVNKPFGLYILPVTLLFYFRGEGLSLKNTVKYMPFLLTLLVLFLSLFIACWVLVKDPFAYINIFNDDKEPPHISRIDKYQLSIYPKQMFFRNEFGEMLHGYHFYLLLLCFLLIKKEDWKKIYPVLLWFLIIFFFVEFFPHKIKNFVPYTIQRIFRYFVIVVPPSIIFISYFWKKLMEKNKKFFYLTFILYITISVYWSYDSTRITRIAFGEVREAIKYLKTLGDVNIYSDWYFISKIDRFEVKGDYNPVLHWWIDAETPEAWKEKFLSVEEGFVVTGGPRLPYYGCYRCIPNLGKFTPPENWKLVKEFSNDLYPPWKTEPLRIWYV